MACVPLGATTSDGGELARGRVLFVSSRVIPSLLPRPVITKLVGEGGSAAVSQLVPGRPDRNPPGWSGNAPFQQLPEES